MTMQQIFYALTVSKEGSINKAAEALYLTQPTLTNAIKELENELGIIIFHRTGKGMVATNDGLDFLYNAKQLYRQYETLTERYADKANLKKKFGVSAQHYSFAVKAFVETVKQFDSSKFEFSIIETQTRDVISDVADLKSEIGVLYVSDHNRRVIMKLLLAQGLEFHELVECPAYVYLWENHPLAKKKSIGLKELEKYPCLVFKQGDDNSSFFAEEILSDIEYQRKIYTNDRSTNLDLMRGLNAYTLCSGIISNEINGNDFVTVPFKEDDEHKNCKMTIGYIVKKQSIRSEVGEVYLGELKKYLGIK